MSRDDAKAVLAALPAEVREACALFVEESHPWLDPAFDPKPGCHCDVSRALSVVADAIRRLPHDDAEWEPSADGGLIVHY